MDLTLFNNLLGNINVQFKQQIADQQVLFFL